MSEAYAQKPILLLSLNLATRSGLGAGHSRQAHHHRHQELLRPILLNTQGEILKLTGGFFAIGFNGWEGIVSTVDLLHEAILHYNHRQTDFDRRINARHLALGIAESALKNFVHSLTTQAIEIVDDMPVSSLCADNTALAPLQNLGVTFTPLAQMRPSQWSYVTKVYVKWDAAQSDGYLQTDPKGQEPSAFSKDSRDEIFDFSLARQAEAFDRTQAPKPAIPEIERPVELKYSSPLAVEKTVKPLRGTMAPPPMEKKEREGVNVSANARWAIFALLILLPAAGGWLYWQHHKQQVALEPKVPTQPLYVSDHPFLELKSKPADTKIYYGELKIITQPRDAKILLDGQVVGTSSPLRIAKVTFANHSLEVVSPGYYPYAELFNLDKKRKEIRVKLKRR